MAASDLLKSADTIFRGSWNRKWMSLDKLSLAQEALAKLPTLHLRTRVWPKHSILAQFTGRYSHHPRESVVETSQARSAHPTNRSLLLQRCH